MFGNPHYEVSLPERNVYNQIMIPLNQKYRLMALEDRLDEANVEKAILQSKVLQLEEKISKSERELETTKRREKTNVMEEPAQNTRYEKWSLNNR